MWQSQSRSLKRAQPRRGIFIRLLHKIATEITAIVSGKAKMNGRVVSAGEIVVIQPGEARGFEALEDTVTTVVKIPGVLNAVEE